MRPNGQAGWHAFAADLNARMALLQVHVEPASNWLYAVCTVCGWDHEASVSATGSFRFAVASHHCPPATASPATSAASPATQIEVLF